MKQTFPYLFFLLLFVWGCTPTSKSAVVDFALEDPTTFNTEGYTAVGQLDQLVGDGFEITFMPEKNNPMYYEVWKSYDHSGNRNVSTGAAEYLPLDYYLRVRYRSGVEYIFRYVVENETVVGVEVLQRLP